MNVDEVMSHLGARRPTNEKPILVTPVVGPPRQISPQFMAAVPVGGSTETVETVLEVDPEAVQIHKKLGEGTFGVVYSGTWNGSPVAIKTLKDAVDEAEFIREVALCCRLRHPNVVLLVGVVTARHPWAIITELLANGSLFDILHKFKKPIGSRWFVRFARDIAEGMHYLHQNHIIHRDLKSANLLLDRQWRVKVCDFGLSRILKSDSSRHFGDSSNGVAVGTPVYMSPEILKCESYDEKIDVYAFAIILWEMLTLEIPFCGLSPVQVAVAVVHNHCRPPLPPRVPEAFTTLIQACWDDKPEKRPSFGSIIKYLNKTEAKIENAIREHVLHASQSQSQNRRPPLDLKNDGVKKSDPVVTSPVKDPNRRSKLKNIKDDDNENDAWVSVSENLWIDRSSSHPQPPPLRGAEACPATKEETWVSLNSECHSKTHTHYLPTAAPRVDEPSRGAGATTTLKPEASTTTTKKQSATTMAEVESLMAELSRRAMIDLSNVSMVGDNKGSFVIHSMDVSTCVNDSRVPVPSTNTPSSEWVSFEETTEEQSDWTI